MRIHMRRYNRYVCRYKDTHWYIGIYRQILAYTWQLIYISDTYLKCALTHTHLPTQTPLPARVARKCERVKKKTQKKKRAISELCPFSPLSPHRFPIDLLRNLFRPKNSQQNKKVGVLLKVERIWVWAAPGQQAHCTGLCRSPIPLRCFALGRLMRRGHAQMVFISKKMKKKKIKNKRKIKRSSYRSVATTSRAALWFCHFYARCSPRCRRSSSPVCSLDWPHNHIHGWSFCRAACGQ